MYSLYLHHHKIINNMAYKAPTGMRPPMSPEAKQKIADSIRAKNNEKRIAMGLPPILSPAEMAEQGISNPVTPMQFNYAPQFVEKEIERVKMKDQTFAPDLFVPMATGKPIDLMFTNQGGVPKACNYMLIGDPGVGKTTVSLDIIADLKLAGLDVLFISAEMTRIDLYQYIQRFPKFGEVDIIFTGEYCESNPKKVLEDALKPGYDVVLIDSFAELQNDIKEALRMSTMGSERLIIDIMLEHNLGKNDSGKNTTFIAIQQVTKGGVFVGSNAIKHNTSGMIELRNDPNIGSPYIIFTKNRRGPSQIKMYYTLGKSNDVEYDLRRFNNDGDAREALASEKENIANEEDAFDKLVFGENPNEVVVLYKDEQGNLDEVEVDLEEFNHEEEK